MQFIISKPGIQKKEENQEKNAEYTVGLHNTKNERESKLYQITDILIITRYIYWIWKQFWSQKKDWEKWRIFNKFCILKLHCQEIEQKKKEIKN